MARQGFQLIEVVVAGAVFFLIAFFVLNLLPTSQLAVARAETRMAAENLAYSTLEGLRAGSYESLSFGRTELPAVRSGNVDFNLSYQVDEIAERDPALVKRVEVTAGWVEGAEQKRVTAESCITSVKRL